VEGCDTKPKSRGLCHAHYSKWRRENRYRLRAGTCSVRRCKEPHYAKGYCEKHYYAWKRYGDPKHAVRSSKGEGTITKEGYRVISVEGKRIFEHRKVMEDFVGRPLRKDEQVHHRNGKKLDNRIENLELWSKSHPSGQRIVDKLAWARTILERYEPLEGTCVAA